MSRTRRAADLPPIGVRVQIGGGPATGGPADAVAARAVQVLVGNPVAGG